VLVEVVEVVFGEPADVAPAVGADRSQDEFVDVDPLEEESLSSDGLLIAAAIDDKVP
jgi:hypothetical protein